MHMYQHTGTTATDIFRICKVGQIVLKDDVVELDNSERYPYTVIS